MVERDGANLTSSPGVSIYTDRIVLANETITSGRVWVLTGRTAPVPFGLNLPIVDYEDGQEVKFTI